MNGVGFGVYSDILPVIADQIPQYMAQPVVQAITPDWIYVTWSGISGDSETGGDLPFYYGLEWDQANGTWQNLTT